MEALRNVAQERAEFCSLEMPRLCTCGPTIWDTHPNLCANNCIFYRNPKSKYNGFRARTNDFENNFCTSLQQ